MQSALANLLSKLFKARAMLVGMEQTQNGDKIYQEAKSLLGTRVAPNDASTDYGILGCAACVNRIVQLALGSPIGGGTSTALMWQALQNASLYTKISDPLPGDIIISPTGTNKYPLLMPNGHVGVVGKYGILSQNSETGLLQEVYTIPAWTAHYGEIGGYPVEFYRVN